MFKEININQITDNTFKLIGKEWMLITAGNSKMANTMTASWGGFGILWNVPVAFIFVRPQRYTYELLENNDFYTLSFFEKKYKNILSYCGSNSGRNSNKIKDSGLTIAETNLGNIYFKEARLVIECKKLYFHDLEPENFQDKLIKRNYPNKDYHRMYTGKVMNCMESK